MTKKRQRNVKLLPCSSCGSLLLTGAATSSNQEICDELALGPKYIPGACNVGGLRQKVKLPFPPSSSYLIEVKCGSCASQVDYPILSPEKADFRKGLEKLLLPFKSPQPIELQFKAFSFKKSKWSKSHVISCLCLDRTGQPYQFKGESSLKILYGAVRDGWFSSRVCWQKYWPKGMGDFGLGTPLFVQRPKLVDNVILI